MKANAKRINVYLSDVTLKAIIKNATRESLLPGDQFKKSRTLAKRVLEELDDADPGFHLLSNGVLAYVVDQLDRMSRHYIYNLGETT